MVINLRCRETSVNQLYRPDKAAHRLILEDSAPPAAGKFTVRLHCAEVDDAQPRRTSL
jgi:hypothetical protein